MAGAGASAEADSVVFLEAAVSFLGAIVKKKMKLLY